MSKNVMNEFFDDLKEEGYSEALTAANYRKITKENRSGNLFSRGSYVRFGSYPMTAEGKRLPIVWKVLKTRGNRALLLSRDILSMKAYETTYDVPHFLNSWLSTEFTAEAFTAEEKDCIYSENEVFFEKYDDYYPVFLLSFRDVRRYFPSADRYFYPGAAARPSDFVQANHPDLDPDEYSWWLSTFDWDWENSYLISPCGTIGLSSAGSEHKDNIQGIRPALWISLSDPTDEAGDLSGETDDDANGFDDKTSAVLGLMFGGFFEE